MSIIKSW